MTPQELQKKYEESCDAAAVAAYIQSMNEAGGKGDMSAPHAQQLLKAMFETVRAHIQSEIDVRTRGAGGAYKSWLRRLGAERAAAISITLCVQSLSRPLHSGASRGFSVQRLMSIIGRAYETEVRIAEAEEVNRMYIEKVEKQVKRRLTKSIPHIRKTYAVAYDAIMKGAIDSSLNATEAVQVGRFGVDACVEAGLVELTRSNKTDMYIATLHPEVYGFLCGYTEADAWRVFDRANAAMLCPPQPWTNLEDGGYYSLRRQRLSPLMAYHTIRKSERNNIREQFTAENMPQVFETANYLQSVPFSIHQPVLQAVQRIWIAGGGVMGIPTLTKPVRPDFPFGEDWDKATACGEELDAFNSWKADAVEFYESERAWKGRTAEIRGLLKSARDTATMWFPVFTDKRNRWYYRGTPNPQGSDIAKAVLHFHTKKQLGKRGLFWLKVHIANSLGYDKKRMRMRADYVDSIWGRLEAALDAPEDHAGVWGTDAPWCAYSAAWELREAYRSGNPEQYETGIVVHMDATCSGLQHFSAIFRDPIGGKYVNLVDTPGDEKQDIYTKVAGDAVAGLPNTAVAKWWHEHGIPRSDAKGPVMTYVYGATLLNTSKTLAAGLRKVRDESGMPYELKNLAVATVAGKALFKGIATTVPAAAGGMRWLQMALRTVPDRSKRVTWKSPIGFIVQHDYRREELVRVKLRSLGSVYIGVRELLDECHPAHMKNSISPNFVHNLDATHLSLTALAMKRLGLEFVGIHDSFGTHACDVDHLNYAARDEFVKMYEEHDVLANFLWDIGGTGTLPKKGKLDLNLVRNSEFFFS